MDLEYRRARVSFGLRAGRRVPIGHVVSLSLCSSSNDKEINAGVKSLENAAQRATSLFLGCDLSIEISSHCAVGTRTSFARHRVVADIRYHCIGYMAGWAADRCVEQGNNSDDSPSQKKRRSASDKTPWRLRSVGSVTGKVSTIQSAIARSSTAADGS